jgi:hypothetical protein
MGSPYKFNRADRGIFRMLDGPHACLPQVKNFFMPYTPLAIRINFFSSLFRRAGVAQ